MKIRCRRKVAAVKSEKLKVFIVKYYDISKICSFQFHFFCSVNSYFIFFILGFQSSIFHKLKNTLNCRLKLNNNNNNQSFWLLILRSSRPEVFCKKAFLEISQNSQETTCVRVSFLIKL